MLRVRHEAALQLGVMLHGAVAVEVVGGDVEEHAHGRGQRRGELDLERRHLDDVDAILCRRRQLQDGGADVAAHLRISAGRLENVGDERRGGRLAVGAGDGDEGRVGAALGALAAEQLDVADDLHAGSIGLPDRPMRLGMGERHPRRQHEGGKAPPVRLAQILDPQASGGCGSAAIGRVIGANDAGAAGLKRAGGGQARSRQAENSDRLASKCRDGSHRGSLPRVGDPCRHRVGWDALHLRIDQLDDAAHVEVAESVGDMHGECGRGGSPQRRRRCRHLRCRL